MRLVRFRVAGVAEEAMALNCKASAQIEIGESPDREMQEVVANGG